MKPSNRILTFAVLLIGMAALHVFTEASADSLRGAQVGVPGSHLQPIARAAGGGRPGVLPPDTPYGAVNPGVLPPDTNPYGASYGEWGARWWQWSLGIPAASSPVGDPTGANCGLGQSGPVWFLAGTSGGSVTRACTILSDEAIFFPIVTYLNDYPCPDPSFQPAPGQSLEDFLAQGAAGVIDMTTELEVEVDGRAVQDLFGFRARSDLFTFTADLGYQAGDPCITGTPQQGVTDGYWIMLTPLSIGSHTLHMRGKLVFGPDAFFETEATYNLTIVPHNRVRGGQRTESVSQATWGLVKRLFR